MKKIIFLSVDKKPVNSSLLSSTVKSFIFSNNNYSNRRRPLNKKFKNLRNNIRRACTRLVLFRLVCMTYLNYIIYYVF